MTQTFQWMQSAAFSERVDRLELHGLHFQHVNLCERRAWMYLHRVNFAQWNSRVATGTAHQATHYKRDRSTVGLFGLAPDRVDWKQAIVFENKGTGGASVAVDRQVGFYAVMLSIATERTWTGRVHVLTNRRWREVVLDASLLDGLWSDSLRLEHLTQVQRVPSVPRIGLCASCSLASFCGYD
ncbi:MAG: Dna2/Cas4 domain-containing protein [Lamprobacter sp.]|uniref:CRISPR-associated protein Cas4 n=1 Tax=Lamprobacter sp. TaxID=3100796 RepID=UPI002B2598A3|nr:Dna2/Cas4 domain-containing protein [Lamprobacter sp.]MEA3642359.1 Dna2/Cas4 domain-containing protein [Lamprobacter sp.]